MQINTFFTGNKIVGAIAMTRGDYNKYQGWELPADQEASDAGFLVEYIDGGKANHPNHTGYISWSPADVFTKNYISIGDITGLPPFLVRLKAERAENWDRLQKLGEFLYKQSLLELPVDQLTDAQAEAIKGLPRLSMRQLALQQEQHKLMQALENVLTARYEDLHPEAMVQHQATLRFSVANGQTFDIMSQTLKALSEQGVDLSFYTGTIYSIPPTSVKLFDPEGKEVPGFRARTEKLARGFSISGNANSEIMFDICIGAETGRTQVTSSFTEDYQLELTVQLADINRRVL